MAFLMSDMDEIFGWFIANIEMVFTDEIWHMLLRLINVFARAGSEVIHRNSCWKKLDVVSHPLKV